jgi:hypothetical protein
MWPSGPSRTLVACKVNAGIHIAVPGPAMYKRLSASTVMIPDTGHNQPCKKCSESFVPAERLWSWTQCRLRPSVIGLMLLRSSVTLRTPAHWPWKN